MDVVNISELRPGDCVTVLGWFASGAPAGQEHLHYTAERSLVGELLRVRHVEAPLVVLEHADGRGKVTAYPVDTARCHLRRLSDEYVRAMTPPVNG